jgi:hypothetical protein
MKIHQKKLFYIFLIILVQSCATYDLQKTKKSEIVDFNESEIEHTFYLIGDAGNALENDYPLKDLKNKLNKADKNSTVIFLGDNIYPKGFDTETEEDEKYVKNTLDKQIESIENFKGRILFIPGNHDWYSGIKALKDQEKYVEDKAGDDTFQPENGCPIEKIEVSDDILLLVVDSEWYITDWDKQPGINDECEYRTREDFLAEVSNEVKKARGKTTIIALHHPIFTNGPHGGQYSFKSHLKPIPILGSLKNLIRKTGGVSPADMQNKMYNELRKRVISISQQNEKVIFVSGHEHSLQYIVRKNLHQIVSGSGSKKSPTRKTKDAIFTYGASGFAILNIFKDGSSHVKFYEAGVEEPVFSSSVFKKERTEFTQKLRTSFAKDTLASIYTEEEVEKSSFYKFLFGERYRKVYSEKIRAKVVELDTIFGGVVPVRKGGGTQSKSLRLEDKEGRQYVMRALRKQPTQYLQATVFKNTFISDKLEDDFTTELLSDGFTGAHPYAPFAVGTLADAIGVYHTNPKIYYVPKQETLGDYNLDFGDELYMIEEHTSEGHDDKASFGYQNKLENTIDMMRDLDKDEDIILDEAAYIKARLFDMLIGDWDRHQDQWRWIEFEENGKTIYRPMPRDRDQAFSKMGDGFLLTTGMKFVPSIRLLRSYSEDLTDVKGVNLEPFPLDVTLIHNADKSVWDEQVKIIQENITNAVIEEAFLSVPEEVRDQNIEEIKNMLKARRKNLQKISDRYYKILNKYAVIKGTNKDDWFDIQRLSGGKTKVTGYRIIDGKKDDIFHERIYSSELTKEIWIYALGDKDVLKVFGKGNDLIKLRLIGGLKNDRYITENSKKVKVYDYESKKNTFEGQVKKKLTDDYKTNVFYYKMFKNNQNQFLPTLGYNPDDGVSVGFSNTLKTYRFERNPFTAKHDISGAYFAATNSFNLDYNVEFANFIGDSNLNLDVQVYSPNYAINFFGFGNSTSNPEANDNDGLDVDFDFNRVRVGTIRFAPSLKFKGKMGSSFQMGVSYESNTVERTENRFIAQLPSDSPLFDDQNFIGTKVNYRYEVQDDDAFPTLGMLFQLKVGALMNTKTQQGFSYLIPELGFSHQIIPNGKLVLASRSRAHLNFNNNFEFYQAAVLGDNTGLRGFRRERFSGQNAFVQTTDLRLNLKKGTSFKPITLGVFTGFDIGRVWIDDDLVANALTDNKEPWNTSYGGGVFIVAYDIISANASVFHSDDGLRFVFGLGFGF